MGEPVQQHLMPLKKYEELDRGENIVLSNGNDAPTLFRNLHSPSMLLTVLHGNATRIIT